MYCVTFKFFQYILEVSVDLQRRIQFRKSFTSAVRDKLDLIDFYRCTVHFEIYVVHSPINTLFINLVKSFKFTLKYTIISLLHVSVFNDHHQGALSVPN